MKKHDLKKLALMGLTGGLLISNPSVVSAAGEAQTLLAATSKSDKNVCGGKGGCPSPKLMAERDKSSSQVKTQSPEDASTSSKTQTDAKDQGSDYDPNESNLGYHLMTEEELKLELNEDGLKMYNSLDEKGKELAREVASMRCAASNPCSHLNACKTSKNSCAGQSEICKHTGKCAVSDKNLAVKLVYDKMKAKRLDAIKTE
jgi:hypothetical protein